MHAVTVGVIANPASGRDIRRLVTGASVFDNAEKGSMVHRLMAGLGAVGVEHVVMMPAGSGVGGNLTRRLDAHAPNAGPMPALEVLEMLVTETIDDSVVAVREMRRRGVAAIVVLGGDGTNRIVARECGDIPICGLSTGTNNAFPEMREATVAGLAVGLWATGRIPPDAALRRAKMLRVQVGDREEIALVDAAVSSSRFIGARAVWRVEDLSLVVAAFARPDAVGFSAIAGQLAPTSRHEPHGVVVELGETDATRRVLVAVAPGMISEVAVRAVRRFTADERIVVHGRSGSVALDGEREIEFGPHDTVEIRLDLNGPWIVDVGRALELAARDGLLHGSPTKEGAAWPPP